MIKAMLANIPCLSKEKLAENRRKIEQNISAATPNNNKRDNEESKQSKLEQEHSQLL